MQGTVALIFKIVCHGILFIAIVVGINAHTESKWTKLWIENHSYLRKNCETIKRGDIQCPFNAMLMEQLFISITVICLALSFISILYGWFKKSGSSAILDTGYNAVAGLLIIVAGILMIVSAVKIDNFYKPQVGSRFMPDEDRKSFKYANKLAAGAIAIIDGLLYFAASGLVHSS